MNLAAWSWAAFAFGQHSSLWSLGVLAYVFGLRHAFDADHIAAIDNVVRKLTQQGRSASTVGLFFSLGHSTVVVLACLAIAASTAPLQRRLEHLHDIGGAIGTTVSASFLLLIGLLNLFILRRTWLAYRNVRRGVRTPDGLPGDVLTTGGPIARLCRPLLRLVSSPWHMYPVGLLFGLGFDTATEVGLLGISAQSSLQGAPVISVLALPVLFTAAMSLLDTTDSMLMSRAYGWAFVHPLRKLWYNLTITAASVVAALCIGSIEAAALVAERLHLRAGFWRLATRLNEDFSNLGYLVVGIFLSSWAVSIVVYRLRNPERVAAG